MSLNPFILNDRGVSSSFSFNDKFIYLQKRFGGIKMKFLEMTIFKNLKGFQELGAKERKRYITLFGHRHFSQWLVGLIVQIKLINIITIVDLFLCVMNIVMILLDKETYIYFFWITIPFIAFFTSIIHIATKVLKMDVENFKKWSDSSIDKVQTLLFADYKVFNIRKRLRLKKFDKEFYQHIQTEECNNQCYRCSFKLAYLLNDSKVKILWISGTPFDDEDRYGHAVLVKNGYILDTNTRRSYKRKKYLKAMQAEIFYEYSLEEYSRVDTPWELKWDEFGIWCEERNVQRCT